jgi:hypothetical protein
MSRGALRIVNKFFPYVTKVRDAKEDFQVEVTAEDNEQANVKDHSSCAMAVACKRSQDIDGAVISTSIGYLIDGETAFRFRVPQSVSREVVSFDRNGGFLPGSYTLIAPEKGHRLGEHYKENKPKRRHAKHRRRTRHVTQGVRASLVSK